VWHYRETGSGRPLVLLHGIGMSHAARNAVTPYLCSTRPVIAFDIAGFGLTPPLPPGTPSTVANLVEDPGRSIRNRYRGPCRRRRQLARRRNGARGRQAQDRAECRRKHARALFRRRHRCSRDGGIRGSRLDPDEGIAAQERASRSHRVGRKTRLGITCRCGATRWVSPD